MQRGAAGRGPQRPRARASRSATSDSIVPVVEYLNEVGGQARRRAAGHGGVALRGAEVARRLRGAGARDPAGGARGPGVAGARPPRAARQGASARSTWPRRCTRASGSRRRWSRGWRRTRSSRQRVTRLERGAPVQGQRPAGGAVEPALALQRGAGVLRHGVEGVRPEEGARLHRHPGDGAAGADAAAAARWGSSRSSWAVRRGP